MAEFTFYTVAMSRGQISRWALHEAAADYEHVMMDWDSRPDSFRGVNPMNKVPVLVHHTQGHDHVITECAAINHYLAEAHPDKGLLPHAHEKAAYFRWLFFAAGPLEQAVVAHALGWKVSEEQQMMAGFGTLDLVMDTLEGWFSAHDFAAGGRFTMADTYLGSQIIWGLQFGTVPDRPAFRAYAARLEDRAAYAAAKAVDAELIAAAQG
jgi:glutathione S-transferase